MGTKNTAAGSAPWASAVSAMPSESATTAAAFRQAASAKRSRANQSGGEPTRMARGSSGHGSRISNTKGVPRPRRAARAGRATDSGVDEATTTSHGADSARAVARAA